MTRYSSKSSIRITAVKALILLILALIFLFISANSTSVWSLLQRVGEVTIVPIIREILEAIFNIAKA